MIADGLQGLESVFGWLLEASWQASVLALMVLAIQWLFRSRLNPRWCYALWLLVLLRLILPVLPESALSLFQFAPQPSASFTVPVTEPLFLAPLPQIHVPATEPTKPLSLYSLLALGWLAGALGLLVLTWQVNRRFARQVRKSPEITDPELLELFVVTKAELNIRRPIRLIESAQVQSPAIMGLFYPTLLLPSDVRGKFDPTELRLIFLHELAHLKRGDVIVQGLIALLQIVHWFNPVLWFAFRRMRADREPATDALVLSRTGENEKERYGLMLIKLLEHFNQRHSLPTLVGILEDKDQFKRRFSLISKFTRGAYGWSLLGILILVVLATVCLTKGKKPSPDPQTPTEASISKEGSSPEDLARSLAILDEKIAEQQKVVDDRTATVEKLRQQMSGISITMTTDATVIRDEKALDTRQADLVTAKEEAESQRVLIDKVKDLPDDKFVDTLAAMGHEQSTITGIRADVAKLKSDISNSIATGFAADHPRILAAKAELATKQQQLTEAIAGMRNAIAVEVDIAQSHVSVLQKEVNDLAAKVDNENLSPLAPYRQAAVEKEYQESILHAFKMRKLEAEAERAKSQAGVPPEAADKPTAQENGGTDANTPASAPAAAPPTPASTDNAQPAQNESAAQVASSQVKVSIVINGKDLKDWKNMKPQDPIMNVPTVSRINFDPSIIKIGTNATAESLHAFYYPTVFEKTQLVSTIAQTDDGKPAITAIPPTPREFVKAEVGWSVQLTPTIDNGMVALEATSIYTTPAMHDGQAYYGENSGPSYVDDKDPKTGKINHLLVSENKGTLPTFQKSVTPFFLLAQPGKEYTVKLQCGSDWVDAIIKCDLL